MSWKDCCLSFVKKYGKAAKAVAGGVLNVVAPGSGALVGLVEQACDKASDTAQDHWEQSFLQATQNNAAELQRLGELFEMLNGDLAKLCDKAFKCKDRPDDLPDILRAAIAGDPSLAQVLHHVQTLTGQFAAVQNELQEIKGILKNFKPGVSYENEDERAFLRQQREKFRQLPRDRQKAADWSNMADRLSEAGLFDLAREEHDNAAQVAQQENNQALAAAEHFKAYRAACEKEQWAAALGSLRQAVELNPQLAPFDWEQYELVDILGAGGFGTVFKCRDRNVHQHVAIKAIHTGDLARGIQEVFKEAVLLTSLKHAAIIGVQTGRFADAARQRPYIIMEYFPSQSLAARLKHGPLPVAEFLAVVRPMAEALRAAHHAQPQPIYHRDVKPDNVLAGEQGQVKVIDFGLAVRVAAAMKSTSTDPQRRTQKDQSYAGTLRYAPPEQKGESSAPVGPYSDIYGFGRTCCELLFGIPDLNEHPSKPKRHHYNRTEDPVPAELVALLKWCLQPIPEDRPQDFQEVLEALDRLQKPSPPPPPPKPPVSEKERQRGNIIANKLGMQFAWVPPGESWLGGYGKPGTKRFTLPQGLWCGVYLVTQAEWEAVTGNNPSEFEDNPRYPVETVSWHDVQQFIEELNQRAGADGLLYRLPTEKEWEYICRGGPLSQEQSKYHFYFARSKTDLTPAPTNSLSSTQANFHGDYPAGTAAKGPYLECPSDVGLYLPNRLGIYDLHGNLWEWTATVKGSDRVIRGGCWADEGVSCAASVQDAAEPEYAGCNVGFRLLALPSGEK